MTIPTGHGEVEPRRMSEDAVELAMSLTASHETRSLPASPAMQPQSMARSLGIAGIARRTLGIILLLVTVFLWTLSNFLASSIFSDSTYDKPFFLVYANSSVFAISLIPMFCRHALRRGPRGMYRDVIKAWHEYREPAPPTKPEDDEADGERLLVSDDANPDEALHNDDGSSQKLSFGQTAVLSLEFSMLWFFANYFASACLEYTSVASVTILTSTSSVWTLIFCSLFGVESFSVRKLLGVLSSLLGVVLISSVDLSGQSDENRGSFPHKSASQVAIGDSMAFISAIIYGAYVTVMKRRVGDESKVNMRLFFGLVGTFNLLLLWPLFPILHWTGIEPFEMPPSGKIWMIIIVNSLASFVSDICWAFAMLLTTPLVVTVGLSLTIPLSLIGEMIHYGQYSSFIYWIGAAVVLVSFVFVNHESQEEDEQPSSLSARRPSRASRASLSSAPRASFSRSAGAV